MLKFNNKKHQDGVLSKKKTTWICRHILLGSVLIIFIKKNCFYDLGILF